MIKRFLLLAFTPLFNFLQSCISPLGQCIDPTVSDSYYYSKSSEKEVIYSPMGNWFELGKTKFTTDATTFKPLSREIGKDKNHIYYESYIQPHIDYHSFQIEGLILRDKHHVYYKPTDYTHKLMVVEDANPKTFETILLSAKHYYPWWAKDDQHYFLNYKKVKVDYATFRFLNPDLVADRQHLYLVETDTLKIKADITAPLEQLDQNYTRMGNTLFYQHPTHGFASIAFDNINSIKIIDDEYILVNNTPILKGAYLQTKVDTESFETFPDWNYIYARDKNHVYYEGEIIQEADVNSFEVVGFRYAKDNKHVYYEKHIVPGAQPKSFYLKDDITPTDGKNVYHQGKPVQ